MYSKQFIESLADFICGDNSINYPIYRSSFYLTGFFQNIGINATHDGSTRKYWVVYTLEALNFDEIELVVKTLVSPKLYPHDREQLKLAINTMNRLLLTENKRIEYNGLEPYITDHQATIEDLLGDKTNGMTAEEATKRVLKLVNDRVLSIDNYHDVNEVLSAYNSDDILPSNLEKYIKELPHSLHYFKSTHSILDYQLDRNGVPLSTLAKTIKQNQTERIQSQFGSPQNISKKVKKEEDQNTSFNNITYDVFISHASEDKEDFVRPLVEALISSGINAWYDESDIGWGKSINQSINNGLGKSRYVIVVISEPFLNKYWTNSELDGAMAKEVNGEHVILPIWHNMTYKQLIEKKPMLAGRLAIDSSKGIPYIVEELKKKLKD